MPDAQLSVLRPMAASVSSSSSSSKKPLAVAPRGGLLFTHRGYSGPAVLDVSHWVVQQLDRQPPAPPEQMPRECEEERPRTRAVVLRCFCCCNHSIVLLQSLIVLSCLCHKPLLLLLLLPLLLPLLLLPLLPLLPTLLLPGLVVDWTGEGAEAWHVRLAAASGASTVETLLRRGGLPVCDCCDINTQTACHEHAHAHAPAHAMMREPPLPLQPTTAAPRARPLCTMRTLPRGTIDVHTLLLHSATHYCPALS